jgi:hypothetical protein
MVNCALGLRKNDLENLTMSVTLWRACGLEKYVDSISVAPAKPVVGNIRRLVFDGGDSVLAMPGSSSCVYQLDIEWCRWTGGDFQMVTGGLPTVSSS